MAIKPKHMILTAMFSALMVVGAFVKIPLPFVAVTLQPFFCAFAGILLGARLGAFSMLIYVVAGLAGAPVFSTGGGITYIFEKSFGYLIGFILAAYVIGKISEKLKEVNMKNLILALLPGLIVIYLIGVPYFYIILRFYTGNPNASLWLTFTGNLIYMAKDLALYFVIALTSQKIIPILKKAGLIPR